MSKRLTGAALHARVIATLRRELADDYGLPMAEYSAMADAYDLGSDMQPILTVTFTRLDSEGKPTGREIEITEIHPGSDGTILQYGSNYGRLSY